jgi:CheY-like chemotaxis protein
MSNPSRETVLYVDDDPDDQEFFVSSLSQSRPYAKCFLAKDSHTAFEIIKTIPVPNYIFIDLNLPKVSGIELLRQLKAIATYTSVPVYILSTTLFEPHAMTIREIGGSGFLRKPSSITDFRLMLESILK